MNENDMNKKKNKTLNVVRGGVAVPIKPNTFLMKGRTHEEGGIDIGDNPKTGIEVEGGEVINVDKKGLRVYSAQPMIDGISPAELVMYGEDKDKIFNLQETVKKRLGLNDDGTSVYRTGGLHNKYDNLDKEVARVAEKRSIPYNNGRAIQNPAIKSIDSELAFLSYSPIGYVISKIYDNFVSPSLDKRVDGLGSKIGTAANVASAILTRNPKNLVKYVSKNIDDVTKNQVKINNNSIPSNNIGVKTVDKQRLISDNNSRLLYETPKVENVSVRTPNLLSSEGFTSTTTKPNIIKRSLSNPWVNTGIGAGNAFISSATGAGTIPYGAMSSLGSKFIGYGSKGVGKLLRKGNMKGASEFFINKGNSLINLSNNPFYNGAANAFDLSNTIVKSRANYLKEDDYEDMREEFSLGGKKSYVTDNRNKLQLSRIPFPTLRGVSINPSMNTEVIAKDILSMNDKLKRFNVNKSNKFIKNFDSFIKDVFKYNTPKDYIAAGSNILGNIISHGINDKMIDNLKYRESPIPLPVTKLKTNININPQIDKLRNNIERYINDVNNNTSSSRTALARTQFARDSFANKYNQLYGTKENLETELINKDKLNAQEVAKFNLSQFNDWSKGFVDFSNKKEEMKSENRVNLVQGIDSTIQDTIYRGEKRYNDDQNRIVTMIANPNVTPEYMIANGIDPRLFRGMRFNRKNN